GGTVNGCPDDKGCLLYKPGLYTNPIWVKSNTAIFAPGIYYMKVTTPKNSTSGAPGTGCIPNVSGQSRYSVDLDSNSVVRPASNNAPGSDGTHGVMFYLSGTAAGNYASVNIDSNSGKPPGGHTIDNYTTSNLICPGASAPPA